MILKQIEVTDLVDKELAEKLEKSIKEIIGSGNSYLLLAGFHDERIKEAQKEAGEDVIGTGILAISNMSPAERGMFIAACLRGDPETYAEYIRIVIADALSTKTGKKMMNEFIEDMIREGDGRAN